MMAKWPEFVTRDLTDSDADYDEMVRRWETYDREMRVLIGQGKVHMDEDYWWFDDATGEMIGPDPSLEKPLTDEDFARFRPVAEVMPELAEAFRKGEVSFSTYTPKRSITLWLDPEVVEKFRLQGEDWRSRMAQVLKDAS
nr:BrnA antitoxin family protein [uncultured Devosia sp.]